MKISKFVMRENKDPRSKTAFNVIRIESSNNGRSWIYCGRGKNFTTEAEATAYKEEREAAQK